MGEHVIKMPDVGEGIAEAELVEWHVKVGDLVREDAVLAAVMTDKATVEIPSPVEGEILWLGAEIGDVVATGSPLVRLKVKGEEAGASSGDAGMKAAVEGSQADGVAEKPSVAGKALDAKAKTAGRGGSPMAAETMRSTQRLVQSQPPLRAEGEKPLASPAVRLRAQEAGIDLRQVPGSGPAGRITHEDLDAFFTHGRQVTKVSGLAPNTSVEDIKVVGLRRRIAEKMALSHSRIPHITYIEEVDVTSLEDLRAALNKQKREDQPRLTLLPFLMRAMVKAIAEQPHLNALYDDDAGIIRQHGGVHIGIAAQTASGLMVPVVKHVEARDLWSCGAEVNRLAEAAKAGTATREELSGSTITITSLGAMGGVATTPMINYPEVAIIGVNKIMVRPVWDGSTFIPRKMMNLSSSFDHRVVDGWDAAVFVQRIKTLLETPAMIFVEG
ncbi:dihydrolipoamide acetyltransferase family protein [Microvirga sp. 2TAF3]|uniref:dihydrolipoamide acetyltransferase family protein n=1 Tax=Microvirga sp. 2TAF3 TaxID=3233014 RepID=UPI003F94DFCC